MLGQAAHPQLPAAYRETDGHGERRRKPVGDAEAIDPVALQGVRTKDGLVAVYDVLHLVTGQGLKACRNIWQRLLQAHPELIGLCKGYKFGQGRGTYQTTPATDARGIVHTLMVLPGPAAVSCRLPAQP